MKDQTSNRGRTLALTGAFLQLGPVIGAAGTAIGMLRAFETLESSGAADPQRLSANIGEVLISTAIGLGFGLVGMILICVALFSSQYRAPWLFWFLVIYGGISLCAYPGGTILGIIILVFCLTRRHEFLTPSAPKSPEGKPAEDGSRQP
jgi:hypothetical protein